MKNSLISKHKERGQSMIELALAVTFLMVLLAGTMDLGRAFFVWLGMRDAAQEGATFGSYSTAVTENQIINYVKSLITPDVVNDPAANIIVTPSFEGQRCLGYRPDENGAPTKPNTIIVSIVYTNFPITTPLLGSVIGNTITIRATINDTIIAPKCNN